MQLVELDQAAIARGMHRLATAFARSHITQVHFQSHPLLVATAPDGQRLVNWKSLMLCCSMKDKELGTMKSKWAACKEDWKKKMRERHANGIM